MSGSFNRGGRLLVQMISTRSLSTFTILIFFVNNAFSYDCQVSIYYIYIYIYILYMYIYINIYIYIYIYGILI